MIGIRHAVALGIVTIFGGLGACASGTDSPVDPADADGDEEVGSAQSDLSEAEALVEWDIRAAEEESGTVFSTVSYALHNRTNGDFLQDASSLGVNLDFGATPTEDFTFRLASGPGTVRFGDKVAIGVRTRGFLAYGAQVAGIWLHFEDSPAYEWRIYGGPVGTPVPLKAPIGLYNTRHTEYVVYCDRALASLADLKWADECNRTPPVPGPVSDAVNTTVRFKLTDPVAGVNSCPFPGSATYTFTPVSLTGQSGKSTAFTVTDSWPNLLGTCVSAEAALNVRAGSWHVTAQSGGFTTSCNVQLPGPPLQDFINFKMLQSGCTQGVSFPGE